MRDVPGARVANLASLIPPRWRPHGLLAKFLLILIPLFFVIAVPGIGYLVHVGLRVDQEVLAARVGNQAARAAAALARYDTIRNPRLAQDLLAPLAADRAFVCAELRGGDGTLLLALPPAQGCPGRQDAMELVLPVREEEGSVLRVRFSDTELRTAERLQVSLAVSVVALAFVFAFLPAIIGFRLIVDRPLRLLLAAIHHSTETGERRPVQHYSSDELGTVIRAFDEMLRHESDREKALTRANRLLQASEAEFKLLNEELEQRVTERTVALEREITERKRAEETLRDSEQRFRSVVNNSPTKIHIKDAEGRYILVNREAEKLFGVTDEAARGKTTDEIFPEKQANSFVAHDQAVLETGQTIEQEEEWLREDGVHTFLTVKFPILDAAGVIVGVGAIGTDITDRKRTGEALLASEHALQERVAELEEAQRKLENQGEDLVRLADDLLIARDEARAADRAKSEFLAAMSHELRTPLNAIIGFSEIITNETFGPVGCVKYREYTNDIHESGQHLLYLINDILDLSKIESGTDELQEDKIEIPEILRSALMLVGHRADQGEIKLELELQDPLPALRADERKLKQILVNLLSNAIKFTDAGGEVALWAWCRMGSGHVFQIIDTGIGIAPENIPKALSRFGQVDADLNRQYEGTGLGLPLTKALVEQHGGILDLQSKVGVGTTVTVRFPADRIVASLDHADSLDVEDRAAS